MISRKVTITIAGVALVGALGGGALALANGDDLVSPARVGTSSSVSDDGTADQGPGDAPGTIGANDDDGTADQGPGDAPGTSGAGEDSHHGGDDDNSGPGGGGEDNSGPGGNSGQG